MTDPIPQDPAPWAAKILALKNAARFQAFSVIMTGGHAQPVTRPEYIQLTTDGSCAEVSGPEGWQALLALEWVTAIEIGGEASPAPRSPRYAARLRALQESGPHGPLVLTLKDGRRFALAGPHEYLVARDGKTVAVGEQAGGLVLLATAEITDLAPAVIQ